MMAVPVLLITGFLGAGKTTLINRLLRDPQGRRLAAVVNDFGAIDIDAALLGSVIEDVISLKNGCICCSLQGDLLRTLSMILRRDPIPDGIVIETSGVSDPAEIVRSLLDPVIWKQAALDAVICVVDARTLVDQVDLMHDALWQSQVQAADYVALSKTDLVSEANAKQIEAMLCKYKPRTMIHALQDGHFPPELLFSADLHRPGQRLSTSLRTAMPVFQTMSWASEVSLSLTGFQRVIRDMAKVLVRAKGFVTFIERNGEPMLFQLVGSRATLGRAPSCIVMMDAVRLVFIARSGTLDEGALRSSLQACRSGLNGSGRPPPVC